MEFLEIKEMILDTEADVSDKDRFKVLRLLDNMRSQFNDDADIDVIINELNSTNSSTFKGLFKAMRLTGFDVKINNDEDVIVAKRDGYTYASFMKATEVFIFMADRTRMESLIDKFKHYGK